MQATLDGSPEHEWLRTKPDLIVYLPTPRADADETNQHFNVMPTPDGAYLATWTTATSEGDPDQRVVFSRSEDRAKTWTPPQKLDGAGPDDQPGTGMASWQFLIQSDYGRIWCFYNKNVGIDDARAADTGVLRGRYSDDDGVTWSEKTYDYPIGPNAISNPDPSIPPTWIVYQNPTPTADGAIVAGFTRWASNAVDPGIGMLERQSEICFLRFENILTETDPEKLVVTTWPKSDHGMEVDSPVRPGKSMAQEPTSPALSDGRLFCIFRTLTGKAWFALSSDHGRTWDKPRMLRTKPGGEPMLNPCAPCPMYKLEDGRFLYLFYNNDGSGHGGRGPIDPVNVRNPAWVTIGREIPGEKDQPIRFGKPKIVADTNWTGLPNSGRAQVCTYPSLVEHEGERILFYPDRKHYLLGKRLTDEWLRDCDPNSEF